MNIIFRSSLLIRFVGLVLLSSVSVPAASEQSAAAENSLQLMSIDDAWIRAVPPVAYGTAGYFRLTNNSNQAWQLVSVGGKAAKHWMIHKTVVENGISRMVDPGPLWLEPGETLLFKPKDLHIMVMGLIEPVNNGDDIVVILYFENLAGKRVHQPASFQVR